MANMVTPCPDNGRCDLSGELTKQRCIGCWCQHGGFQVHNHATRKLLLMQAATQLMLFCGPRREGEPEESFDQRMARRACLKAVIESGFMRAAATPVGPNHATEFSMLDYDNLTSHGWALWLGPRDTTCYNAASIDGRLLLRLAEAEAQLENLPNALQHARRAAELLSTLDKGQGVTPSREKDDTGAMTHYTLRQLGHPARALLQPAQELVQKLSALQKEKRLTDQGSRGSEGGEGTETPRDSEGGGGGGKKKKSGGKKGGKKR